jgi:hypothetical protein
VRTVQILLFISLFPVTFCLAQGPVSKNGSAVASSQVRVSIPSYAVVNLAKNNSKSIAYNSSSDLKDILKLNTATKVEANDKWSVNVIREKNNLDNTVIRNILNKSTSPTYTVIYVATQI